MINTYMVILLWYIHAPGGFIIFAVSSVVNSFGDFGVLGGLKKDPRCSSANVGANCGSPAKTRIMGKCCSSGKVFLTFGK